MKKNSKILVGMSGGVDSSVSTALLKKQGFDVVGVFMQFWKDDGEKRNRQAQKDAQTVADILDIPLLIVDARQKFQDAVVKYFLKEYSSGKTPNPCVFCNKNLKFKMLLEEAEKRGFNFVATGHYAKIKLTKKTYQLFEAKDKTKDQSYFLYQLGQKELLKIIFPLGEYEKKAVRALAKKMQLPVFDKIESQDVCFLAGEPEKFLEKNLKLKKGKIVDDDGKIIGEHRGLALYTFGQRKGINIGGTGPYYVVEKDEKNNILHVSNNKKNKQLFKKIIRLEEVNWIAGEPKFPKKALARTRYRNSLISAIIREDKFGEIMVELEKPEWAVSPGQSTVFYSKNGEVLGGGIII